MAKSNEQIYEEFQRYVNMTVQEIENWLKTGEAQSVGIKKGTSSDKQTSSGGTESKGKESGRMIIDILRKKKSDLTDDQQMSRVVGYNKPNATWLKNPAKKTSKPRAAIISLMNWGYDPLKD